MILKLLIDLYRWIYGFGPLNYSELISVDKFGLIVASIIVDVFCLVAIGMIVIGVIHRLSMEKNYD